MKRTVRVIGAPFYLHYDPRPPRRQTTAKRAAVVLARHIAWTTTLGAVLLTTGEIILQVRGVL